MPLGFIESVGEELFLHVFEKTQAGISYKEGKALQAGDAYLAGLIDRLDRVYADVPLTNVQFRILSLPFAEPEKIEGIIPFQLEGMITDHIGDIVYDFQVLGKSDDYYRIAVVFIRREEVQRLLDRLAVHGIRPEVITSVEAGAALSEGSLDSLAEAAPSPLPEEKRIALMAGVFGAETVNFAKGAFSFRKDMEKAKRYGRSAAVLLMLASLLLALHFVIDARKVAKDEIALRKEMGAIYSRLVPSESRVVDSLYQLKARMKQLEGKKEEIDDVNPLLVLKAIAETWASGKSAEGIKMTPDLITIFGEAESAGDVKSIADALSAAVGGTPVIETKQASGGKTGYTLQIRGGIGQ